MHTTPNIVVVLGLDKEWRGKERQIYLKAGDKDLVALDRISTSSLKTVKARFGNKITVYY